MLITRPNHDLTTNYLYFWSKQIIDYAVKIKKSFVDLLGKRANIKEYESVVIKVNPKLLVFNGHGDKSSIFGFDDEPLVESDKNINLLNGKIVYARACSSASKLGRESIKRGCQAYIGYDDEFVFMTEDDKSSHPLQDRTAELFLGPANLIVISLLKGHTASESNTKSRELYRTSILRFMTSEATPEQKDLIPLLVWDYDHQICLGNPEAHI